MIIPDDIGWLIKVIITGVLLPIFYSLINSFLTNLFNNNYLPTQGKREYKDFLISNSKPISDFFYTLEKYKENTSMKYFWFFEGGAIGALFSIASFIFCVIISQAKQFSKFPLIIQYYNYFYCGQKDIDLIGVVISFNFFSLISMLIIALFLYILYSKGYDEPKLTEELSLKKWSKYVYYVHWFSMGILIGVNFIVLYFTLWFHDLFLKLLSQSNIGFFNYWSSIAVICVYLICIFTSFTFFRLIYNNTKLFSNLFKQKVTDSYLSYLPQIRIKTDGGNVSGKLNDVQNESLIILNDGFISKAIRWDQIKIMEIEKADVNTKITTKFSPDATENNKPWWKFWQICVNLLVI